MSTAMVVVFATGGPLAVVAFLALVGSAFVGIRASRTRSGTAAAHDAYTERKEAGHPAEAAEFGAVS